MGTFLGTFLARTQSHLQISVAERHSNILFNFQDSLYIMRVMKKLFFFSYKTGLFLMLVGVALLLLGVNFGRYLIISGGVISCMGIIIAFIAVVIERHRKDPEGILDEDD